VTLFGTVRESRPAGSILGIAAWDSLAPLIGESVPRTAHRLLDAVYFLVVAILFAIPALVALAIGKLIARI
jgi:hypothetical protein